MMFPDAYLVFAPDAPLGGRAVSIICTSRSKNPQKPPPWALQAPLGRGGHVRIPAAFQPAWMRRKAKTWR